MHTLETFAAAQETLVKEARKSGGPAAILAVTEQAAAAIDSELSSATPDLARPAQLILKRLLYNAAADCWPGWETGNPVPNDDILRRAKNLAERSHALVAELGLGPMQTGNAVWLVGAFDLALGDLDAALAAFQEAEIFFNAVPARHMALMAQGYAAIATELAGKTAPPLSETLAALAEPGIEYGQDFVTQLVTARQVFLPAA